MRTFYALMLVLLVGCATKPRSATPPMPPSIDHGGRKLKSFVEVRKPIMVAWEDCTAQPSGVWYRVYESLDFKSWHIYAQVTNSHRVEIPTTNKLGFYAITATDGTKETLKAGKWCP